MGGTKSGAQKMVQTIYKKYGNDFYVKIGTKGGKKGRTGGFYANRELASTAGRIGGKISKRGRRGSDLRVVLSKHYMLYYIRVMSVDGRTIQEETYVSKSNARKVGEALAKKYKIPYIEEQREKDDRR